MRLLGHSEGGAISPTRALSVLLPKVRVVLFKLIKKPFGSGKTGGMSWSCYQGRKIKESDV